MQEVEVKNAEKHFHTYSLKKIIDLLQEAMDVAIAEDPVFTRVLFKITYVLFYKNYNFSELKS